MTATSRPTDRSASAFCEVAVKEVAVRQTGQAVMEGLVFPGRDLAAKPVEQPATPDGHSAVGRQDLEEAQVLAIEGDRVPASSRR